MKPRCAIKHAFLTGEVCQAPAGHEGPCRGKWEPIKFGKQIFRPRWDSIDGRYSGSRMADYRRAVNKVQPPSPDEKPSWM